MARAIAEFAFVTSELPVILSLEMHCSAPQQHQIASLLTMYLGEVLLSYDELVDTGRAALLSPLDLKGRVLLKGKVKELSKYRPEEKALRRSSTFPASVKKLLRKPSSFFMDRRDTSEVRRTSEDLRRTIAVDSRRTKCETQRRTVADLRRTERETQVDHETQADAVSGLLYITPKPESHSLLTSLVTFAYLL